MRFRLFAFTLSGRIPALRNASGQISLYYVKRPNATSTLTDQMLDLAAGCFDAPTLKALARLRLSPKLAARVNKLAGKANEGRLTASEREEYLSFINASELLAIIQLRARLKLKL